MYQNLLYLIIACKSRPKHILTKEEARLGPHPGLNLPWLSIDLVENLSNLTDILVAKLDYDLFVCVSLEKKYIDKMEHGLNLDTYF